MTKRLRVNLCSATCSSFLRQRCISSSAPPDSFPNNPLCRHPTAVHVQVIAKCQHCPSWHKLADAANLVEEIRYADLEDE